MRMSHFQGVWSNSQNKQKTQGMMMILKKLKYAGFGKGQPARPSALKQVLWVASLISTGKGEQCPKPT